ncbi:toll/interleukin-1 receptor domain-containing protein [Candidatus Nitrosotalea bavarica]|uniref:toll/interleukin-1 receptor domain-containing protein n=1 Tax=Candidatus Nitrosotalea bavarica TaxID=1903277 RepID=UPI0013FDF6DD|nr:toll/interleukin-1 receptor domain-containing protein [Candidatus Nitrosotalea bavarica]
MNPNNLEKQEKIRRKFKVFVCYSKEDHEKARILEFVLYEKGFGAHLVDNESHGSFISTHIKETISSSVCFVLISTTNFINSSLINQEIGYAQGKGLQSILLVSAGLLNDVQDVNAKIIVIEFNEDNFRQQCILVANRAEEMAEILDEPIDLEAFLDFYTKLRL